MDYRRITAVIAAGVFLLAASPRGLLAYCWQEQQEDVTISQCCTENDPCEGTQNTCSTTYWGDTDGDGEHDELLLTVRTTKNVPEGSMCAE